MRLNIMKKKLERALKIVDELSSVAEMDGEITAEEQQIINSISANVNSLYNYVNAAMVDEEITDEEMENIHVLEKRIIQEASSEAFKDGKISTDEKALLTRLILLMEEM